MEHLLNGLSILINWKIYIVCLISILIYTPFILFYPKLSESLSGFFLMPFIGAALQAFATIFLFKSVYIAVFGDVFIGTIISNSLGIAFGPVGIGLFLLVLFVCIVFSGNDFDFLIGIIIYHVFFGAGGFFPAFPDFVTIIAIIGMAIFNLYITPVIMIPINMVFGDEPIMESPSYAPNGIESFVINYAQTLIGLIPPVIYLSWLLNN